MIVLIILGAIFIPFYDLIFRLFPNVTIIAEDSRSHKEMLAIIIALALGLSALYQGKLKPFKNKWLFFFILSSMVSINLMPRLGLHINGVDNSGFWVWKPMFEIMCFLLMLISIYSMKIRRKDINLILRVMFYVGFAEAIYVILQSFSLDQFFYVLPESTIGTVFSPERVGSLGQPTLVASFMVMVVPIGFYLRKYLYLIPLIISIFLTHSHMAIGSLIVGIIVYASLIRPKSMYITLPSAIGLFIYGVLNKIILIESSGRFEIWQRIISDIKSFPLKGYEGVDFSIFGHGLGSLRYYFQGKLELGRVFGSAHNEYLEIFYCCGAVGLFLFLMALFKVFKNGYIEYRKYPDSLKVLKASLLSSLVIISICAAGNFVWQLGAHCFYSILVVGLLLNETITGGVE